ncbi:retron system putative HNH endonuclease [Aeromonas dhakensis]|uniref:retron system putative HNH endonuclease n=1 Tax=Aeromonas dhakensis TaxID=196024 RepID=UPI00398785CB
MRHFVKDSSPEGFEEWKALANEDWQPTYEGLQNPQKRTLHQALLDEQGGTCCYCGRSISLTDSHIEHFQPQELRRDLALSFENLFASCIRETKPGAPLHCGHAKGNDFDEARHISPLDHGCERRFIYKLSGGVLPTDTADTSAQYMSDLLQLDIDFLRNRRHDALSKVFDDEFIASATNEELEMLALAFRQHDAVGQSVSFGHVLARFAEQLLGRAV